MDNLVEEERLVFRCVYSFIITENAARLPRVFHILETSTSKSELRVIEKKTIKLISISVLREDSIQDYTITQTTLERAFLDFAKLQEERGLNQQ